MLPSQYLILKLSYICIWKVSSLFNKGISSFYCIYMYFMYLFQNNFNSSTPTCFIYIRENDIFPYWAHLDVPQTLLELSNSQGKQWAEVWSHITNGQLMALLGQKFLASKTFHVLGRDPYGFLYRNSQSRQQSMQVLTETQHVTSQAQSQNIAPTPAIMSTRWRSEPI